MKTHAPATQTQSSTHSVPIPRRQNGSVETQPDIASQLSAAARFGHRLSDISLLPPDRPMWVRPSDDHYEKEADRVAERILAEAEAPGAGLVGPVTVTPLSPLANGGSVQRHSDQSNAGGQVVPSLASAIHRAQHHGGQPLPQELRSPAERVLKTDLSRVRLHQGHDSQRLVAAVGSNAFATGENIFLGGTTPTARSRSSFRLIAHELTHTQQQRGLISREIQRGWEDDWNNDKKDFEFVRQATVGERTNHIGSVYAQDQTKALNFGRRIRLEHPSGPEVSSSARYRRAKRNDGTFLPKLQGSTTHGFQLSESDMPYGKNRHKSRGHLDNLSEKLNEQQVMALYQVAWESGDERKRIDENDRTKLDAQAKTWNRRMRNRLIDDKLFEGHRLQTEALERENRDRRERRKKKRNERGERREGKQL